MNRWVKALLILLVGVVIVGGAFAAGALVGYGWGRHQSPALPTPSASTLIPTTPAHPSASAPTTEATPQDLNALFAPFWEAWRIVHDQYVDQPVDDVKLMRGAIRGMLDSLGDPHTDYMNPDDYKEATTMLEGEYEGIGAWVDISGDYLTIISPMPGSPAEKAGLQPGDQIIAVDGDDVSGVAPEVVRKRVLGPAGTQVRLTIRREGVEEPFDVAITRAHITIPSVEGRMLDNSVAYVQIYTFGEKTGQQLHEILQDLLAQNPKGLIIDLRNNGGGYLSTAIQVASEFLPEGTVVMYERYGDDTQQVYKAQAGGLATDIPLVVLINEGSASASEIVAGAIQDHGRGLLVGTVSYGKGSVQNLIPLQNDQGAVRVTVARWYTPKERLISGQGLTPNVTVELTKEDIQAKRDPQLDKAVKLILQGKAPSGVNK
ncbi:MAG TPA: S41 family peptidase [Anaerolineae bacterium]|nr:S41 family peptidase [Anaerolineae bacterium]